MRTASASPAARVAIVELSAANATSDVTLPESDASLVDPTNPNIQVEGALGTDAIQAMQHELALDPNTVVVESDGLAKSADNIHYSAGGYHTLGARIFQSCF